MRSFGVLLALPLAACLQMSTGTGSGVDAGRPTIMMASRAAEAGPNGTNCIEDLATQTILCEQVDTCPGLVVDPGVFPDCGFRVHAGGSLDLECLCGQALCPLGVPTTCQQAKELLAVQSAISVCQQQLEGRCVQLSTPDAGLGGTCDKTCRGTCSGDPNCLQLCGC
jgi:hypothetical protein